MNDNFFQNNFFEELSKQRKEIIKKYLKSVIDKDPNNIIAYKSLVMGIDDTLKKMGQTKGTDEEIYKIIYNAYNKNE